MKKWRLPYCLARYNIWYRTKKNNSCFKNGHFDERVSMRKTPQKERSTLLFFWEWRGTGCQTSVFLSVWILGHPNSKAAKSPTRRSNEQEIVAFTCVDHKSWKWSTWVLWEKWRKHKQTLVCKCRRYFIYFAILFSVQGEVEVILVYVWICCTIHDS